MTMLSGPIRRPALRARALPKPPLFEAVGPDLRFRLLDAPLLAVMRGGLYHEVERTLVVSDLHLEKGSAFGVRGQFLPPYDTRATLARLAELIERLTPARVVALGDSFHDVRGPARMAAQDVDALAALVGAVDEWIWIEGNHDPQIPSWLGGRAAGEARLGPLRLVHEPSPSAAPGEIAGHLHPCARVNGRGRSVRVRCFALNGDRLILPAFGAYAGGLNVRDAAFAPLFPDGCVALALGRERLYPAALDRLSPDV